MSNLVQIRSALWPCIRNRETDRWQRRPRECWRVQFYLLVFLAYSVLFWKILHALYCCVADGKTRNKIDYISITQKWKASLMNCRTCPEADCDTDYQLLMATLKVLLAKRQKQHSIPPLNLEELMEDKAEQFAAEVTNSFTALEAALDEVTPKDR